MQLIIFFFAGKIISRRKLRKVQQDIFHNKEDMLSNGSNSNKITYTNAGKIFDIKTSQSSAEGDTRLGNYSFFDSWQSRQNISLSMLAFLPAVDLLSTKDIGPSIYDYSTYSWGRKEMSECSKISKWNSNSVLRFFITIRYA